MQVMKKEMIYFDNAATTNTKPQEVHDFMYSFYAANSVNVDRGTHQMLNESSKLIASTRNNLVNLFNGNSTHAAVFTATATEAINIILQGTDFYEGDNIYISPFEHNAVYRVVKHLELTKKINIIELNVDRQTLEFNLSGIKNQFLLNKPKMIIVTHVSNVCGNIAPIEEIGLLAKEHTATYVIDCAQSAGLLKTDIIGTRADYMIFAGHKTLYGPFGCSGFICSKSSTLRPLIFGGTGKESANEKMPVEIPDRFEAGSKNIMAIAGLFAALEWNKRIGIESLQKTDADKLSRLLSVLSKYKSIKIIGNRNNTNSILSCTFSDYSPNEIEKVLSERGVIVRSGLHCAPMAHRFLDTFPAGTVRFSVSYFTSDEDFTVLDEVLKEVLDEL